MKNNIYFWATILFSILPWMAFAEVGNVAKMSDSEKHGIIRELAKCWSRSPKENDLITHVYVTMNLDGSLKTAQVSPTHQKEYQNDTAYKKAADNAVEVIKNCNLSSVLPKEKFEVWREMELTFNPTVMLTETETDLWERLAKPLPPSPRAEDGLLSNTTNLPPL